MKRCKMARQALRDMMDKLPFVPTRTPRKEEMTTKKRSRSAGDMNSDRYELRPLGGAETDGEEIAPGEGLPAHPDDADLVAVEFKATQGRNGSLMRILDPHSHAASETRKGDDRKVAPEMVHLTQPWFYSSMERTKCEGILAILGHVSGSFLVRQSAARMSLSMVHNQRVYHFIIGKYADSSSKQIRYSIGKDHSHASISSLVKYYETHSGSLPCPLKFAITRTLIFRRKSEATSYLFRLNTTRPTGSGRQRDPLPSPSTEHLMISDC